MFAGLNRPHGLSCVFSQASASGEEGRVGMGCFAPAWSDPPLPNQDGPDENALFSSNFDSDRTEYGCVMSGCEMSEAGRQKFLAKANAVYSRKPNNTCVINKYEYVRRVQRLLAIANGEPKVQQDQRLLKNCCLVTDPNDPGNPKLCKANTTLAYVAMEDMYDILHSVHLQLNHAGRNCMQRFVRTRYCNVSKDCIMMFLTTCDNCPRQRRMNGVTKKQLMTLQGFLSGDEDDDMDDMEDDKEISMASTSAGANASVVSTTPLNMNFPKKDSDSFARGQFEVFNMNDQPDGVYHAFLRYVNLQTREVRLRPLIMDTVDKIADSLIDIFCDQGAPVVLQSRNGRQTVKNVVKEINKILPQCRLLDGSVQNAAEPAEIISSQLNELMRRHGHNNWAKMLRILQFELNSTKNASGFSPFEVMYGRQPSMGLKSSKLLDAIYEKTQSEEEIMEYLQDAELVRMSVFCQQAPTLNERKTVPTSSVRSVYDEQIVFNNHYSPINSQSNIQSSPVINQFDIVSIAQNSTPTSSAHYTHPHTPITSHQATPQPQQPQQQHLQQSQQPQNNPPPQPTHEQHYQHAQTQNGTQQMHQTQPGTQQFAEHQTQNGTSQFAEHQNQNIMYNDPPPNDIIIKPEGMSTQQQHDIIVQQQMNC
ncbi:unnamed protein product [Bursaphelenchus okinawaensis]|uniref:Integrase catalytic domain-containing protein n=1 Tax=Bursaphelenchus okinawaensis TaxID=465554 RepID=A0A811LKM5_9BILA|nr:unnamed protein product [Bursaphelenchus okinawaensis]CAG9123479.1 unnamed protein product [Bursaphelenchus okinawaensis]